MKLSFWVAKRDLCKLNVISIKETLGCEMSGYRQNTEIKKLQMTPGLCLHVVCVEGFGEGTERERGGREKKERGRETKRVN